MIYDAPSQSTLIVNGWVDSFHIIIYGGDAPSQVGCRQSPYPRHVVASPYHPSAQLLTPLLCTFSLRLPRMIMARSVKHWFLLSVCFFRVCRGVSAESRFFTDTMYEMYR